MKAKDHINKQDSSFDQATFNRLVNDVRTVLSDIRPVLLHPLIKGSITAENITFQQGIVYAACYGYEQSHGAIKYPMLEYGLNSLVNSTREIEAIFLEHDIDAFKEHRERFEIFKQHLIALRTYIELR